MIDTTSWKGREKVRQLLIQRVTASRYRQVDTDYCLPGGGATSRWPGGGSPGGPGCNGNGGREGAEVTPRNDSSSSNAKVVGPSVPWELPPAAPTAIAPLPPA